MRKTRKPKYYVAQVGLSTTSNSLNNISDPVTQQFLQNTSPQQPWSMFPQPQDAQPSAVNINVDRGNRSPINTASAIPQYGQQQQSQKPYNPGQHQQALSLNSKNTQNNPLVTGFNALASGVTAIAGQVASVNASRKEAQQYRQARQPEAYNNNERYGLNGLPAYSQLGGWVGQLRAGNAPSRYQVGGETTDDGLTYSDPDETNDYSGDILEQLKAGGWIKGAVNPAHKGYCTPMTKSTCTPRRKAFAETMKKHHGFHKAQLGGELGQFYDMGAWSTYDDEDEYEKAQAGGSFTPQEQALVDSYTAKGYNVTKDPTSGQLKYVKSGVTANPQTAAKQQANQAASQAAVGNPNAPIAPAEQQVGQPGNPVTINRAKLQAQAKGNPYLNDSNHRYYWGELMNRDFPNSGGNVRQGVLTAAKQNNIDPSLLYASAMEEGMSGAIDDKRSGEAGADYVDWSTKNADKAQNYPVDGFYNYGLDQFAGQAKDLEKKGYLPKGFSTSAFTTYQTKNEKGEKLNAPAFDSDQNALIAKSAMMRQAQDQLDNYAKKTGVNLSDKQKTFFTLANYNGGEGNMQKMLASYKDKGYLKDDSFIDNPNFKPEAYGQIYGNVQARIQSANLIKKNGYFDGSQNQAAPEATTTASPQINANSSSVTAQAPASSMKAGGLSREADYGSKNKPYPMVNKGDFAGGHRSYPIPTKADARDALRLAGLHHRADVKAKVYAKYPDLRKQYGGAPAENDFDMGNVSMLAKAGGWIKGAINPAHKGYCTPMSKSTCTPRRKALARRFKSGDLHKGQVGGDLYNDVPQYEIDNNMLMQAGGDIQQVQGLDPSQAASANVEAERGEVYTDAQGNMRQVDTNGNTHEQGGEMLPQVHRVLENTSNLRKDKISKYLKLAPGEIKALTGLDTNKHMSHAEALVEGAAALDQQKQKIVSNIALAAKGRANLDMYGENSTKFNIDHFRAIPTKDQLFNRLFDHQELTKNALGISNDGEQAKMGGRYRMKAQTGIDAYPGNTSGQTTPAGNSDAFQGNLSDYLNSLRSNGFNFKDIHSNADLQKALYSHELKNNPQAIRNMWQEGIQNYGLEKATKAGFVYDKDDPTKGIKKGQFKPGVLDDPANLQKLADLYPDNLLGRRILNLSAGKGPKVWTDENLPPQPQNPQQPGYRANTNIKGPGPLNQQPKSEFNQPLNWYDIASPIGAYLAGSERISEKYNPAQFHQLSLKLLDPTAPLQQNQADFNAAVQATQQANPNDVGTQMANIANLTSRKYALNNQVLGNYENQNTGIKNQEIQYNTQVRDRQSVSDQQSREALEEKVLTSKAKQQEQKLTALDGLYKTVAENAALNRNGNLIMKMSRAFDQYGNYNGYAPSFQPNPQLGIPQTPQQPGGKYQPAGGIQGLTPGKSYYNRRTGKTMRYDGTNLVEVK